MLWEDIINMLSKKRMRNNLKCLPVEWEVTTTIWNHVEKSGRVIYPLTCWFKQHTSEYIIITSSTSKPLLALPFQCAQRIEEAEDITRLLPTLSLRCSLKEGLLAARTNDEVATLLFLLLTCSYTNWRISTIRNKVLQQHNQLELKPAGRVQEKSWVSWLI